MKDANLNKTIKFIDKKAEYEYKNRKTKLAEKRLKLKDHSIIKYEERKKSKEKKEKKEKIKNSAVYKSRKKIITVLTVVLSLFVVFFLWTIFIKPNLNTIDKNNFKVESQNLSKSEISTYSSIMKESVKSTLDIDYKVIIKQVHRNGNLIYGAGSFNIPDKGDINFDIVLKDYTPYSLKINGNEYIE